MINCLCCPWRLCETRNVVSIFSFNFNQDKFNISEGNNRYSIHIYMYIYHIAHKQRKIGKPITYYSHYFKKSLFLLLSILEVLFYFCEVFIFKRRKLIRRLSLIFSFSLWLFYIVRGVSCVHETDTKINAKQLSGFLITNRWSRRSVRSSCFLFYCTK